MSFNTADPAAFFRNIPVGNSEGALQDTKQQTIRYFRELLAPDLFFTTSCTTALEFAALTIGIQPGDEVIMPSFTFVGTANAFALFGAKIVFVDIDPETMCMDARLLERALSEKTKAIVPVHYAGNACDMQTIMQLARKNSLYVIEDAAQGIYARCDAQHLGTIGDIGCISFDYAKNIQCDQGGVAIVNNPALLERADQIYHNGSNRTSFLNGEVPYYEWCALGSNFTMPNINYQLLSKQIIESKSMQEKRQQQWAQYYEQLQPLAARGLLELPYRGEESNAHIFYIKTVKRDALMQYLRKCKYDVCSHYTPLHSSRYGRQFKYVTMNDCTNSESAKLLRLPLQQYMNDEMVNDVVSALYRFFE